MWNVIDSGEIQTHTFVPYELRGFGQKRSDGQRTQMPATGGCLLIYYGNGGQITKHLL